MVPSIAPLLALPLLFPDIRGWHIAFPNNSASHLDNDLREGNQPNQLAFIFPGGSYQSDVDVRKPRYNTAKVGAFKRATSRALLSSWQEKNFVISFELQGPSGAAAAMSRTVRMTWGRSQ